MPAKFNELKIKEEKEKIIQDVKDIIKKSGSTEYKNYKQFGKYSDCKIRNYFTNWTLLLSEIGMCPAHKRGISKESIIDDVISVFNATGNTTRENYLMHGSYSRAPIKRMFGGWNALLKEINISINMYKNISKEDVINDFLKIKEEFADSFNSIIYRKHGKYSQPVIDRLFGSHSKMMEELGFDSNRWRDDHEIINDLRRIHSEYNIISQEIINNECIVSSVTIRNRFGDIKELLQSLGLNSRDYRKMSKIQENSLKVIEEILGDNYVLEKTFEWLRYSKTNRNMFIDIFYQELSLAIEVDGSQHYMDTIKFGKCEEIQLRDREKDSLLTNNGIHVIRIRYDDSRKAIRNKINTFIKK